MVERWSTESPTAAGNEPERVIIDGALFNHEEAFDVRWKQLSDLDFPSLSIHNFSTISCHTPF